VVQWRADGENYSTAREMPIDAAPGNGSDLVARVRGQLTAETKYFVRIGAVGPDDRISWSTDLQSDPWFVSGPMRPAALELFNQGRTTLRIAWTARFLVPSYAATDYEVQYRRVGNTNWLSKIVANTNLGGRLETTLDGLRPGTDYEIQIRALRNDDPIPDLFPWQSGFSRSSFVPDMPRVLSTLP
jgi:hypothetical protein